MWLIVSASSSYFPVFSKHVTSGDIFMVMNMRMGKDMISARNMNTKTEGTKNNLHMQTRPLTHTCTRTYLQTLNGGLQLVERVPYSFHKLIEIKHFNHISCHHMVLYTVLV